MNVRLLSLLSIFLLTLIPLRSSWAQYVTVSPRVDDVNDEDVRIQRVELTSDYTAIYMTFQAKNTQNRPSPRLRNLPFPYGGRGETTNTITFRPGARLYVNQGERSYKFIRAENIPIDTRREVSPGERVDFVAYFERIDPGYTVFDLYECRDSPDGVCFNFWGVHITNPKKSDTYAQRKPAAPAPPRAQPRYTPRTTPGMSKPQPKPAPEPVQPPTPAEPAPEALAINGITRDAKTNKLISATLTYRLLAGAEAAGDNPADSVQSGSLTGDYRIATDVPGRYVVKASRKGYFSQTDTIRITNRPVARDFNLVPIETGAKVTLKNIYFNVSRFDLKPESFPELDQLVSLMQTNPTMTIRLEGHTDTVGDFDANVELSRNRVNEVKRYLVGKGISAGRIDTVGYGPSRPINTNRTLKERPENRRVELVITKA